MRAEWAIGTVIGRPGRMRSRARRMSRPACAWRRHPLSRPGVACRPAPRYKTSVDRTGPPAAYLNELLHRLREVLRGRLEGAWLVGSGALGDYDPARSDIDVQAVTRMRVSLADRHRVARALSHDALPCPVRGLEFVLYARDDLEDAAGPALMLNLNTGPGMTEHVAFTPDAEPRFWFTIDVAIARQHGRTLAGPPAATAFPELPRELVVPALQDAMEWFAHHDTSAVGTVLGACRTWAWATDGHWRSKAESAAWARSRLADPRPVDKALALRDDASGPPLMRSEVDVVLASARRALDAVAPARRGARPAW
jgi:hypothetical protein